MFSLTITAPAAALIGEALRHSEISDPVVNFLVQGDPTRVHPELAQAILDGAGENKIRELDFKYHGNNSHVARRRLLPAIFPRDQFPKNCLVEVSGFVIAFPAPMIAIMTDWTLEVTEDGGMLLKDANGAVVMPEQSKGSGTNKN